MRQHIRPIHIARDGQRSAVLQRHDAIEERHIQALVHDHPELLPIMSIDPAFAGAVPICRELRTPAGPIDNFLITPTGLPVLVECKLWKNPQARREVVGQALDYAKELGRWTAADLERAVAMHFGLSRGVRGGHAGPTLADRVGEHHPDFDEILFYETLTRSLARGRMLLLIVGDGIKESVEAIFETMRNQGALQFSLGLVEMPIFDLPDGSQIVVPRILASSVADVRTVVELPAGLALAGDQASDTEDAGGDRKLAGERHHQFFSEFLDRLTLDDPEQPSSKATKLSTIVFSMPVPDDSCWLTAARVGSAGLSVFISWSEKVPTGARVMSQLMSEQGEELLSELGGNAAFSDWKGGKSFRAFRDFTDLDEPENRRKAQEWLAERVNSFVNVLRPAIKRTVDMMRETGDLV